MDAFLGESDRELRLFFAEGDRGNDYTLAMHGTDPSKRELEALAALGGKLLARALKQGNPVLDELDPKLRWWRFMKNRSQAVFKTGEGWTRETISGPIFQSQHGLPIFLNFFAAKR